MEVVKVRHILFRPALSSSDELIARNKLDSIRTLILNEETTFIQAVERFSEDDNSKSSGGLLLTIKMAVLFLKLEP